MGQDRALRRGVAFELVGHDHARHVLQAAQQLAQEPLGGPGIAPALDEDVEHMAVLVHRPPEVVLLAADADEHLIHVLFVARPWPAPLQLIRELPTKAQAPLADALVTDHDAAGGQDRLDVAQA